MYSGHCVGLLSLVLRWIDVDVDPLGLEYCLEIGTCVLIH